METLPEFFVLFDQIGHNALEANDLLLERELSRELGIGDFISSGTASLEIRVITHVPSLKGAPGRLTLAQLARLRGQDRLVPGGHRGDASRASEKVDPAR